MSDGATVVEILPRGFSSARNFGASKFTFLPSLGIRHAQIVAQVRGTWDGWLRRSLLIFDYLGINAC
eukprot:871480-Prymnesium_polylepis.2